jgi:hypothetical protein
MFTFPIFSLHADRSSTRRPPARRPLVEDLEGRWLLSGIIGNHIGISVSTGIQGNHFGKNVSADIKGNHIGTNVA